jgi:hypothetical protein
VRWAFHGTDDREKGFGAHFLELGRMTAQTVNFKVIGIRDAGFHPSAGYANLNGGTIEFIGWQSSCCTKIDQAGGVVTSANLGPKENGGRPGMTTRSCEFGRAECCRVFAVVPCFMGLRESRNRPMATWRAQQQ